VLIEIGRSIKGGLRWSPPTPPPLPTPRLMLQKLTFIHLFIHSSIQSVIHSFIQSVSHSFIHSSHGSSSHEVVHFLDNNSELFPQSSGSTQEYDDCGTWNIVVVAAAGPSCSSDWLMICFSRPPPGNIYWLLSSHGCLICRWSCFCLLNCCCCGSACDLNTHLGIFVLYWEKLPIS